MSPRTPPIACRRPSPVHAALSALRASAPELQRPSLLDVGAEPGTALWTAAEVWPDLSDATLVERDECMIALGQRLARYATAPAVRDPTRRGAAPMPSMGDWATACIR